MEIEKNIVKSSKAKKPIIAITSRNNAPNLPLMENFFLVFAFRFGIGDFS